MVKELELAPFSSLVCPLDKSEGRALEIKATKLRHLNCVSVCVCLRVLVVATRGNTRRQRDWGWPTASSKVHRPREMNMVRSRFS